MNLQEFLDSKLIKGKLHNETIFVNQKVRGEFIINTIDIVNHKLSYNRISNSIRSFCNANNISETLYMKTIRKYVVYKGIEDGGPAALIQVPINVNDVNSVVGVPEDECGGREGFGFKLSDLRGY